MFSAAGHALGSKRPPVSSHSAAQGKFAGGLTARLSPCVPIGEVHMPSGKTATPEIVDNKDGTVTVRYAPTEVGLHEMHIKYMGSHIPGESGSGPRPPTPHSQDSTVREPNLLGSLQMFRELLCGKHFSVTALGMQYWHRVTPNSL